MKLIAISDTHGMCPGLNLPQCDILIHAGDATMVGQIGELIRFGKWMANQPATHRIFVPGNHEVWMELHYDAAKFHLRNYCPDLHILNDESVEVCGLKVHGSPVTPWFHDWAWNRARNEQEQAVMLTKYPLIAPHWDLIPDDTDILVTHGPPLGVLDYTPSGLAVGCAELRKRVSKVKPRYHIFGHIHGPGGTAVTLGGTTFVNASICNERYEPTNLHFECEMGGE